MMCIFLCYALLFAYKLSNLLQTYIYNTLYILSLHHQERLVNIVTRRSYPLKCLNMLRCQMIRIRCLARMLNAMVVALCGLVHLSAQ